MNKDVKLDQLFAAARDQAVETSFEETKKRFLKGLIITAGGVLATKGILHLLTKKTIIMISLIATVTTTTAVVVSSVYNNKVVESSEMPATSNNVNNATETAIVKKENNTETKLFVESTAKNRSKSADDSTIHKLSKEISKINNLASVPVILDHPTDTNTVETEQNDDKTVFVITSQTTEEELQNIQAAAKKAGIELTYDYKLKNGELSYATITMILKNKDGKQKIVTSTDFDGDDQLKINWRTNEKGKAIEISTGDVKRTYSDSRVEVVENGEEENVEIEKVESEHEQESLRDFMKEIKRDIKEVGNDLKNIEDVELPRLKKLREKLKDLDSLSQPVKVEIEEQIVKIEDELKRIHKKLKEMDEEEREEKNREEMEEMEEELEDVIEELEENLEDLEEELEEIRKNKKEEKEGKRKDK